MDFRRMIAPLLFATALCSYGADGDRTVVKLHLNRGVLAWSGMLVDFGSPQDAKVIAGPGETRVGSVADVVVLATPSKETPGGYTLQLKTPQGEPASVEVTPKAPVTVQVARPAGLLPYQITLNPNSGPNGSPWERLFWLPNYRAEGTLAIGSCRATIAVWDMTANGRFDRADFRQGSAVGIDLNGDGQISGKGEFMYGGEVFEFCGRRFFVDPDSMEPDGSAVTVVETTLEKPRVGSPVPTLELETTDGDTLTSEAWKGKPVILDFWASWCGYCIAGFPKLQEMRQATSDLLVISINTDEPSATGAARNVVATHSMPWPRVMSGQGLNDPAWMMFQGLEHSLPLYVLLDRQNVIRYSGSGGENLEELRAAVEKYTGSAK